ncbi:GNAT family N-acetyltransferase [Rossellomorea vietnamensis]|uniref:GNAT family N-acetyltransferase n=1 Tax=Rossellomorea vietnamensis TaxID=218284 RepID=A0A5D4NR99_9BACI|nr:GNAT family N-acetyltransferase [Rossellomorea vietnamensis]TYS16687.1 GNAT family N-acetyltransferase [Rossellomorea vietnamensis]
MNYDDINETITSRRLVLRKFLMSDSNEVARLCNNYNIYRNTMYLPYPYSKQDALCWIETHSLNFNEDKLYEFAITDKGMGTLYGAIALSNNHHNHHGEIAYWIGEEYWGKGYATEAAETILKYAFAEKNYHKVFARHFGSNPSSGRVLKKIGMEKEGVLKEHIVKDDRYEDLVYYGVMNPGSFKD